MLTFQTLNMPFGHSAFAGEPAEFTKQREFWKQPSMAKCRWTLNFCFAFRAWVRI
jgi:hypothetical protein